MRSRFSAYALGDLDYIIKTTHPENPGRKANLAAWRKDLLSFSKGTSFDGLKIIDFVDGQERATVTFTARLRQGAKDASFTEKSSFEKVDGRWLYKSGEMQNFFS